MELHKNQDIIKWISVLKRVSFFSDTTEKNLNEIARLLTNVNFDTNESIFKKGDYGNSMFIIIQGCVKVHDGDHVFTTLKNEQFFGEFSLLDAKVRSASVTALEPTELLKLDQTTFFEIMSKNIEVSKGVLQSIIKRLYDKDNLEEELARKNAEILRQNKEIEEKNEVLNKQKEEITIQRNQIERINKDITDSIKYALRIQQAILPPLDYIDNVLPDSFVLYLPKSIVSGDFYWISEKDDTVMFAAVDCTGHGVPGAFMSFVGYSLLKQAINEQNLAKPSDILNSLSKGINETLRQTNENIAVKDGMDLVLCSLNKKNLNLQFAGVHNPLYILRNNEILEFKPDKQPIGEPFSDVFSGFTNNEFQLQKEDSIYIFSDGYIDQFGGPDKRKFMSKRFKETLINISALPMSQQKDKLLDIFKNWKEATIQIDDVLVIGVKV
jgi:serine phosphatase RsbU (regulator of sigma subunit)